jgi:hypothetical protein
VRKQEFRHTAVGSRLVASILAFAKVKARSGNKKRWSPGDHVVFAFGNEFVLSHSVNRPYACFGRDVNLVHLTAYVELLFNS